MKCRFCKSENNKEIIDLGRQVPANFNLIKKQKLYPLKIFVCKQCYLVQTQDYVSEKQLFGESYPYYSSFSNFWMSHAKDLSDQCIRKYNLNPKSFVIEIASNDGYFLQNMVKKEIPCMGIEPSIGPAKVAEEKGIEVIKKFFSFSLSQNIRTQGKMADLIVANNVIAHVPDIFDFVKGIENILSPNGVVVIEFQYIVELIKKKQFDTIYHEHFSYLSIFSLTNILAKTNLVIIDVMKIKTHGGSLRVFLKKKKYAKKTLKLKRVTNYLKKEKEIGINNLKFYRDFEYKVRDIVKQLRILINDIKNNRKVLVGYGAAAKSSCIINSAKITEKELNFVIDKNPNKQNTFIPGTKIPIVDESFLEKVKPDYIIIFPWNIKEEIKRQISYTSKWGAKIFVCIPKISWLNCD